MSMKSRREFIVAAGGGLTAASCARRPLASVGSAAPANTQDLIGDGRKRPILLRGGVVLSLDAKVGDFEKADVLINGKLIAQIAPTISAPEAEVVDCSGTIVMPGFITTHHHQYETLQRSIIADGLLAGAWPLESYGSVVQNIWTAGRLADPNDPTRFIWDLGRVPYDPEDCYISELVTCLSEISEGVTCGTDTSQANHTPEHTDAMIKGLMDSGRRMVFDYSGGTNRSAEGIPFEAPGAMNDTTKGIGRLAKTYFSSKDQLVTLGLGAAGGPAFQGASYTGWQLARSFGALINTHNVGNPMAVVSAAADSRNGSDWSDVTLVHCTRWQEESVGQVGAGSSGYPNSAQSRAWAICRDRGVHVSIANLIEMQMRHGMPPFQLALNHGILPSLSPDVDTNMTTDPFSLMRGAFIQQRGLANDLAFPESNPGGLPVPQLVTSRQVIEMATIAGAASSRLLDKVGTLTPGKEADVIMLKMDAINVLPVNNAYGAIVQGMDTSNVDTVFIRGTMRKQRGQLVGVDLARVSRAAQESRDYIIGKAGWQRTRVGRGK